MKSKLALLCVFAFSVLFVYGQDKTALHYASLIDSTNLKTTLSKLASDEFEGRGTAEKGGEMTINYLADYLKGKGVTAGNKGSYFQNIGAAIRVGGQKRFLFNNFDYVSDYSYENTMFNDSVISADKVLFAGYGIYSSTYNDYANMDITDKVVMVIDDKPANKFGLEYAIKPLTDEYFKQKCPKAVIKVRPGFRSYSDYSYRRVMFSQDNRGVNIPEVSVNERLANKLLESTGKTIKQIAYEVEMSGASPSVEIDVPLAFSGNNRYEDAKVNNVVAIIEGRDLKDQYVVISAHHDHDGKQYNAIYNGADDNASGVAGVLEIATVLAKAKKEGKGPRRTVVILFPAAEERGLHGSKFYADNPIYSLDRTVACINLDMIGRVGYDYEGKGNNYVYIVNHKTMSGDLVQQTESINNNSLKLTLDYKHTSPGDNNQYFSRSDQYNFAEKGVPSIMFSSGEHKDYHKTTDDAEFIDFDGAWKRTKLAFLLIWDLANSDKSRLNDVEISVTEISGK